MIIVKLEGKKSAMLLQELIDIKQKLDLFIDGAMTPKIQEVLDRLENSAKSVGRAWSGSWIGYHANVYYEDLQPPPPGRHFSSEWGFLHAISSATNGDWIEYDPDYVRGRIEQGIDLANLEYAVDLARIGSELFDDKRDQVVSILEATKSHKSDSFLDDLLSQAKSLRISLEHEIIANIRPGQYMSRDSLAMSQGMWTPPHLAILAKVASLRAPIDTNRKLAKIIGKAESHMKRTKGASVGTRTHSGRVFIGHGHSRLWKDLKDFIQDRLKLEWDEFNRVPVAGITNISRLSEMLNSASIAFLVMTAEDEQSDGSVRARMNVIHEAGLFQGSLGFTKAIVLLEEGCEEFSNIQGLGQIRFPRGNISASFEEIRSVLEREGILKG